MCCALVLAISCYTESILGLFVSLLLPPAINGNQGLKLSVDLGYATIGYNRIFNNITYMQGLVMGLLLVN